MLEKMKKNLGLGPNVRRRLTKNSGDARLHYFFGYLLTGEITQPDEKSSPELRIFAGVQRESCSKKLKKNLGLGPVAQRCLTKNSGDPVNSLKRVG